MREVVLSVLLTGLFVFLAMCCYKSAKAGVYLEAGLGVPLAPEAGYIPDQYGVVNFGYNHPIDDVLSFDLSYQHRSLTGAEYPCGTSEDHCYGMNAIEGKFRLEW